MLCKTYITATFAYNVTHVLGHASLTTRKITDQSYVGMLHAVWVPNYVQNKNFKHCHWQEK